MRDIDEIRKEEIENSPEYLKNKIKELIMLNEIPDISYTIRENLTDECEFCLRLHNINDEYAVKISFIKPFDKEKERFLIEKSLREIGYKYLKNAFEKRRCTINLPKAQAIKNMLPDDLKE